jgi:hypothetical protein
MRATLCWIIVALLIDSADGADAPAGVDSLKGLTDVHVTVEVISKEAEAAGLKKADLKAQTEKAVKAAGLRVLAANERARGTPAVYLSVIVFPASKQRDDLFVYSIDLSLLQEVRLSRSPGIRVQSATWRPAGAIGTIPKAELPKLKETVSGYLQKFTADFRAANQ